MFQAMKAAALLACAVISGARGAADGQLTRGGYTD